MSTQLAFLMAGLAVSGEARHGEGHGDAVVQVAVEDSAVEGTAAPDDHAVVCGSDVTAHGPQVGGDGSDAVALLDLQLRCVPGSRLVPSAKAARTAGHGAARQ